MTKDNTTFQFQDHKCGKGNLNKFTECLNILKSRAIELIDSFALPAVQSSSSSLSAASALPIPPAQNLAAITSQPPPPPPPPSPPPPPPPTLPSFQNSTSFQSNRFSQPSGSYIDELQRVLK